LAAGQKILNNDNDFFHILTQHYKCILSFSQEFVKGFSTFFEETEKKSLTRLTIISKRCQKPSFSRKFYFGTRPKGKRKKLPCLGRGAYVIY